MLHMSWHQCHCDLYRLGLDGYSEAAPSPILLAIHPRERVAMQFKCFEHAESIIRIASDFLTHGNGQCLLERDAAVCAFESARLVMFSSRIPGATSSLELAINKAKLSLNLITQFFPYSASTQPLVRYVMCLVTGHGYTYAKCSQRKDLERLMASYSVRLALQTQETFSEPGPPSTRPSTKVSQYASSRQRLSVQSLLLQSDFVDDSNEIAGPTQGPTQGAAIQATTNDMHTTPRTNHVSGLSSEIAITPRNQTWNMAGITGQVSSLNGQAQQPSPCLDAGQEDAGLIFNPWMGFAGTEDMYYGVSVRPPDEEF